MSKNDIRSRSFTPPASVAKEAKLGQRIRASMSPSQQCCVETGIRRGEQLATRSPVTVDDMITMRAWFDRHEVDKQGQGWGVDSKGYQAWLLWGGDSGREWVEETLAELGIERHRAKKNPAEHLAVEQLSTLPVGAVVATPDGVVMFRKIGASKTDWERVRPSARTLLSLEPQEKGSKVFVLMTKLLNREGLVLARMQENPSRELETSGQMGADMNPVELASLLALLRAVYQLHQAHHWQSRGPSYYGDHLLYQRLYEGLLPEIDAVAERTVGLSRDTSLVDPTRQAEATKLILEGFRNAEAQTAENAPAAEAAVIASLEAEMNLLRQIDTMLAKRASNGVQNLLQGIADKHEGHVYLLQQRLAGAR